MRVGDFATSCDIFADLLSKTPDDWVVGYILDWQSRQLANAINVDEDGQLLDGKSSGRDFRVSLDFYNATTSFKDCLAILKKAREALAVTEVKYQEAVVRSGFLLALWSFVAVYLFCCFEPEGDLRARRLLACCGICSFSCVGVSGYHSRAG